MSTHNYLSGIYSTHFARSDFEQILISKLMNCGNYSKLQYNLYQELSYLLNSDDVNITYVLSICGI